jgi:hypothetical protein
MQSLPVELIQEILLHLSLVDLSRVCQVCSDLSTFSRDWNFWAEKAWREYQFPRDLFKSIPLIHSHPRDRYVQVRTYCTNIYPSNDTASLDQIIRLASITGPSVNGIGEDESLGDPRCQWHIDVIKYFISQRRIHRLNYVLCRASEYGNLELVQYCVSQGAWAFNDAATECARNGHFSVLRWLIDHGATKLDRVLYAASAGGHLEMVQYLILHGATDYEGALQCAQENDHNHIISYLLSLQ